MHTKSQYNKTKEVSDKLDGVALDEWHLMLVFFVAMAYDRTSVATCTFFSILDTSSFQIFHE